MGPPPKKSWNIQIYPGILGRGVSNFRASRLFFMCFSSSLQECWETEGQWGERQLSQTMGADLRGRRNCLPNHNDSFITSWLMEWIKGLLPLDSISWLDSAAAACPSWLVSWAAVCFGRQACAVPAQWASSGLFSNCYVFKYYFKAFLCVFCFSPVGCTWQGGAFPSFCFFKIYS